MSTLDHHLNNLGGPTSPMLHTKDQYHGPYGSGENFEGTFATYRHCDHLGHVTKTIKTYFRSIILRSLNINFSSIGPVVSEKRMFENNDNNYRLANGRQNHWYTISSSMSLQLRWAKERQDCLSL